MAIGRVSSWRSVLARIAAPALAETDRWPLWLPVALACGVATYFALSAEPAATVLRAALALGTALVVLALWRARAAPSVASYLLAALGLACLGFGLAGTRAALVAAPVIERPQSYALAGRVILIDQAERGLRVTLDQLAIEGLEPARTPRTVRLTLRGPQPAMQPGDRLALRARLQPPMAPSLPGGFDFARAAWFEQLGGLGWSLGPARIVAGATTSSGTIAIAGMRHAIAERFWARVPGVDGAVAAALFTGLRGAIDAPTWTALQRSGLAHIVSISGLHVGLVAVSLVTLLRLSLALVPALVLRWPARKLAALGAIPGLAGYLLLAGASIPTQRAFLMTSVALLAVLLDRDPISMRLIALAAALILVVQPESLVGASFQFSFAAMLALVAWYESLPEQAAVDGLFERVRRYVVGVLMTTLVAGLATAPLGAFHFNTISVWGSIANLIGVPLTAFWIMPVGTIAVLLMPLGLDGPFVWATGQGVAVLLETARLVADLPGAAARVAQLPALTLGLAWAGGLWLCLWRGRWRRLGLLPLAASLLPALLAPAPIALQGGSGELVAIRLDDRGWARFPARGEGLVSAAWLRGLGLAGWSPWPARDDPATGWRCDRSGCARDTAAGPIVVALHADAVAAACGRAALILSIGRGPRCSGSRVIDPWSVRRRGTVAIFVERTTFRAEHVGERRGRRPWTLPQDEWPLRED